MKEAQEFPYESERPAVQPVEDGWKSRLFDSNQVYQSGVKILEKLRGDIEAGNYAMLLGDDASGRLHTRLLGEVIKGVYGRKGYPPPTVRFVAGSGQLGHLYDEKKEALREYVAKLKQELSAKNLAKSKVLVVSDIVFTGNSLNLLAGALQREGILFDLVSFSGPDDIQLKVLEGRWGTRIVRGVGGGGLYGQHHLAGVEKHSGDLHAHLLRGFSKAEVGASRADIKIVAQNLSSWFLEGEHERREKNLDAVDERLAA